MKQGHRDNQRRKRRKPRNIVLTAFCVGLVAILLGMGIYVAQWYLNLGRIRTEGERYARMYGGREVTPTPQPVTPTSQPVSPTDTPTPTRQPIATPTSEPTPSPTPVPAVGPDANMPVVVDEPIPAGATLPATVSPEVTPVPVNTPDTDMPIPVDVPIPTPDSDTLVIALPTAPPVQESFKTLLAANPDTVGFLEIEGMLSLPVVQRPNDNDYYLDHSFEGAEAQEGTLFLDGMNRLVPEDDCLIVYGHNMKNRTMFGRLSAYADISHLRQYPVVHFDTLYENRSYVAFAAFSASMKPGDSHYFDVRNFIFDKDGFDNFVLKLKGRSVFSSPIEVLYGDHLLLLVTCDYSNREGRFILALRQLRANENEGNMFAEALRAEMK
jgi:sortase B